MDIPSFELHLQAQSVHLLGQRNQHTLCEFMCLIVNVDNENLGLLISSGPTHTIQNMLPFSFLQIKYSMKLTLSVRKQKENHIGN